MKANRAEHDVTLMCEVLDLSKSGFYDWLSRGASARRQADERLTADIREEHLRSRGIYGAPRIAAMLKRRGHRVGQKRVARLMRESGLVGVTRRRKFRTTVRDSRAKRAPDLVGRRFEAEGPDHLWVADITHIPTREGALYLATILDVWSRKIVGWAIDDRMPAELVVLAMERAVAARRPVAVTHHSDQGSQYTSLAFSARCAAFNVSRSMGAVGDCYDNAMAESFFATLEAELLALVGVFDTREAAKAEIFAFLEGFYNTRRLHSALGQRSPCEFERAHRSAIPSRPQVVSLPPHPPRATDAART